MTEPLVRPPFVATGEVVGPTEALRITRAAKAVSQAKVDKKAEVLVIPEPEVRAHVVDWTEKTWPQGMRTIGNLAVRQGFRIVGSHARGPYIGDVPLRVMRICDSILLRMSHDDGRRASALWMTNNHDEWELECMFVLRPVLRLVKNAAFKTYLKTPFPTTPVVDLDAYDVTSSASSTERTS